MIYSQPKSYKQLLDANCNEKLLHTSKKINIQDFLLKNNISYVDFIKSDIDGYDYDFLRNIKKNLIKNNVLSLMIEVSFADNFNDESDITRLLKNYNFGIHLLSTRNYSSKYLPDQFKYTIPAQTISGRIVQGDALYIKDIARYKKLSPQKLLKMSIIMDLFNLTDLSAQIFSLFHEEIEQTGIDVGKSLNLLAKQRSFLEGHTYKKFIKKFYANDDSFYLDNQLCDKSKNKLREKYFLIPKLSFLGKIRYRYVFFFHLEYISYFFDNLEIMK